MRRLLIADDEPLALVGVRSMLRWEELGLEICAAARNGEQALQYIAQFRPDIVITDIKMPVKTGLEVMEESRRRFGSLPVFIMLTGYEDFSFAKEALHYGAMEYLVKLELTQQSLTEAVLRALARVEELTAAQPAVQRGSDSPGNLQTYRDAFFAHLYFATFASREQFSVQSRNLGLDFPKGLYAVAACELAERAAPLSPDKALALYTSATQMAQDTAEQFVVCHVTSLDTRHFNILFHLEAFGGEWAARLREILEIVVATLRNYFNVGLLCAVGKPVTDVFFLRKSYCGACALMPTLDDGRPVAIDDGSSSEGEELARLYAALRDGLIRAFEAMDAAMLEQLVGQLMEEMEKRPGAYIQAMNIAVSLQHMSMSLLSDGEAILNQIFADEPDNYRSLYLQTTSEQCRKWIGKLSSGLCERMRTYKQSYKKRLVKEVQEYIKKNLDKRLSICDVANEFHFSPNYLSQIFAQCSDCGYVDYVTREKVSAAKAMMAAGDAKIYEISEKLGYNSAFYFSKVFKKVTGQTPREYMRGDAAP